MITVGQVKRLRSRQTIYAIGEYNADGTPLRWVVSGVPQLWKTRPNDFRVPLKRGLYDHGYLTPSNARYFSLKAPAARKAKRVKAKRVLRTPRPYYPEYGIR